MVVITAIKRGLYIAGRIDRKYNINKIFIQKYAPPGYRKQLNRLVDIGGTIGGGYGLYQFINSLIAPETPGNGAQIPFKKQRPFFKANKSYQTRGRRAERNRFRCHGQYYSNSSRRQSYSDRYR